MITKGIYERKGPPQTREPKSWGSRSFFHRGLILERRAVGTRICWLRESSLGLGASSLSRTLRPTKAGVRLSPSVTQGAGTGKLIAVCMENTGRPTCSFLSGEGWLRIHRVNSGGREMAILTSTPERKHRLLPSASAAVGYRRIWSREAAVGQAQLGRGGHGHIAWTLGSSSAPPRPVQYFKNPLSTRDVWGQGSR